MLISILLMACVVSSSFVALRFVTSAEYEVHGAHQTIYVEPSYVLVIPCMNFTVNVNIRDVTDLYAWQFNMTFDPTIMQCVSVTQGPFLLSVRQTIFPPPGINNVTGEIKAGCSLLFSGPGASGNGTLATITFHCTGPGGSVLDLHDTKLLNSSAGSIPPPPYLGDIDGNFIVNIMDVVIVVQAYCSRVGEPRYNPQADLNSDGAVDIEDLIIVMLNFGHTYPPNNALQPQNNVIAHIVEDGYVTQGPIYRYKAKFEYGWQSELVGTHFPSLNVPVETLTTTHINVYNPNDFPVHIIKYFVKVWPEKPEFRPIGNCNYWTPYPGDGRTCHIHIDVPERKGFEIDAEDVQSWPPDPTNPIQWLVSESFWKGFVVIECPYELEVAAVYDKVGVDVVNKITFHLRLPGYIDTLIGSLKFYEPYELSVTIPFEPENITLEDAVWRELDLSPGRLEDDPWIEVVETKTYFDFLECVTKDRIVFTLRPTDWWLDHLLNQTWPPAERPLGWKWPAWFRLCTPLEKIVKIRSYPYLDPTVWETFWSMGDVNRDGYINYKDLNLIVDAYGSTPGDPNWNPNADLNKDLIVDSDDVYICGLNFGKDIWTYSGMPPQEAWGPLEKIRDPEKMVRENLNSTLIELGVPPSRATIIVNQLNIEIIEVDVAEGVGTGIDVEYIEPEIIETPTPP